jgi:hypothetical protein
MARIILIIIKVIYKLPQFPKVPSASFPKFGNKIKSQDENNKYGKKRH